MNNNLKIVDNYRDSFSVLTSKSVIYMDDVSLGNRNGIIHAVAWNTEIYK